MASTTPRTREEGPAFPVRLYNATIDPKVSVIQWDEAGKTIVISDERACATAVLGPEHVAGGASALRQLLQKHGFMRLSNEPVTLRHPCFIRYKRSLLKSIQPLVPEESEPLADIRSDVEEVKDSLADVRQCIQALVVAMHHAGINVRPTGVHESLLERPPPSIPASLGLGDLAGTALGGDGEHTDGEWSDGSWESGSEGCWSETESVSMDTESAAGSGASKASYAESAAGSGASKASYTDPDSWLCFDAMPSADADAMPAPPQLLRRTSSFDAAAGAVAPVSSLPCAFDEFKSEASSPRSLGTLVPAC